MVESRKPGSSRCTYRKGRLRVLSRWSYKPQGMAGIGALACVPPVIPVGHLAAGGRMGFHGTRVPNGTTGRPEGRGGGTG